MLAEELCNSKWSGMALVACGDAPAAASGTFVSSSAYRLMIRMWLGYVHVMRWQVLDSSAAALSMKRNLLCNISGGICGQGLPSIGRLQPLMTVGSVFCLGALLLA